MLISNNRTPPLSIAVEGINGSGKTTLINKLKEVLRNEGYEPVDLPYKSMESYKLAITTNNKLDKDKYFRQAFKDAYSQIVPTLTSKNILILDRFLISNLVYRSIDGTEVKGLEELEDNFIKVDTLIYLDCDPKIAFKRIKKRGDDRFNLKYLELKELKQARELFITYFRELGSNDRENIFFLNQRSKFSFFKKYKKFINKVYKNSKGTSKIVPFCYF